MVAAMNGSGDSPQLPQRAGHHPSQTPEILKNADENLSTHIRNPPTMISTFRVDKNLCRFSQVPADHGDRDYDCHRNKDHHKHERHNR